MLPNILQGPSLLLHKSFLILGNAARCAPLKIPQNASEDDIRVLFFHVVLFTVPTCVFMQVKFNFIYNFEILWLTFVKEKIASNAYYS